MSDAPRLPDAYDTDRGQQPDDVVPQPLNITPAPATAERCDHERCDHERCDHEYTLNVQLTHAWCQKCDSILLLVAGAIRDTIYAAGVAAERQQWRDVLAEHYLLGINCGNVTHPGEHDGEDNPMCGCSRVFLGWHPTIGAARDAWLAHVADLLDGGGQDTP